MKTKTVYAGMALVFAMLMLFFTFFTWGWFSDDRGFQTGFEVPVGTKYGAFGAFADVLFLIAPALVGIASLLSFRIASPSITLPMACVPLALYAGAQFVLALAGKKTLPLPLIGTLLALLVLGILTVFVSTGKIRAETLSWFWLWYAGLELFLALFSILAKQRVSAFYFAQLLPFGSGTLSYSYFVLSVFFYHLAYPLAVFCLLRNVVHTND